MSDCMSLLVQSQFAWHKFPRFCRWIAYPCSSRLGGSTYRWQPAAFNLDQLWEFFEGNLTGQRPRSMKIPRLSARKMISSWNSFSSISTMPAMIIHHPSISFMSTCHSCIPSTQLFFVKGLLQRHICEVRNRPRDGCQISVPSGYVNSWRTWKWPSRNSWYTHKTWWFSIVVWQFTRG